jgi:hypothetical protein
MKLSLKTEVEVDLPDNDTVDGLWGVTETFLAEALTMLKQSGAAEIRLKNEFGECYMTRHMKVIDIITDGANSQTL